MEGGEELETLLEFLRDNRGCDFTGYKRASLQRRIGRRMQEVGIESYLDYGDYLQFHSDEFVALFNTILINVTSFFRDADSWAHLQSDVVPRLMATKRPSETLRIWSAGTASGEEAYSIAMLLAETLGEDEFRDRIKIYATDVDEEALNEARHAVYAERKLSSLSEELRGRYFERQGDRFAFRKDLRRCLIFGRNDLIQDAPISRVDLLLCRNTLMYFSAETQERVLRRFHFALNEGGVLFLGKAEMLLSQPRLFRPIDARRRFFQKIPNPADTAFPVGPSRPLQGEAITNGALGELALDTIPQAAVVISTEGAVAQVNRQARQMLGLSDRDLGRTFQELDVSTRPADLRPLIDRVSREGTAVTVSEVARDHRYFDVTVAPLLPGQNAGLVVLFQDVTATHQLQSDLGFANRQLETSYEELQSTVEELETTNEELQSTVEELETTNEELQSTNEELETTNEELQSTNDELQSANEELNERSADVSAANAFLESILRAEEAAVIVVGPELQVRAWSERADEMWGVRPSEAIGQHLMTLDIGLSLDTLYPALRGVLSGSAEQEMLRMQAINRRGRSISVRIRCRRLTDGAGELSGAIMFIEELAGGT